MTADELSVNKYHKLFSAIKHKQPNSSITNVHCQYYHENSNTIGIDTVRQKYNRTFSSQIANTTRTTTVNNIVLQQRRLGCFEPGLGRHWRDQPTPNEHFFASHCSQHAV